jgi:hypothetical protein
MDRRSGRPSPGTVLGVIAIVFAVAGTSCGDEDQSPPAGRVDADRADAELERVPHQGRLLSGDLLLVGEKRFAGDLAQ